MEINFERNSIRRYIHRIGDQQGNVMRAEEEGKGLIAQLRVKIVKIDTGIRKRGGRREEREENDRGEGVVFATEYLSR